MSTHESLPTTFDYPVEFALPPEEIAPIDLPRYHDIGIEKVDTIPRPDLASPFGSFWQRRVWMSDGQRHTELIGVPTRSDASKIPMVSIPAWNTSPVGGFNLLTANRFLAIGLPTIMKGLAENKVTSLSRGAWDTHLSLRDLPEREGLSWAIDTREIFVQGDSNGGMQGTGIMAYAPIFGRKVVDAFLVDPCIARRPNIEDLKKAFRHPQYVAEEGISFGRQMLRTLIDSRFNLMDYQGTIDPSLGWFMGNLLIVPALGSGEFGILLRNLPKEQKAHYLLFGHSLANQKRETIDIIEEETPKKDLQVTYEVRTGTHASIINPRTINDKIDYFA